jgi:CubicO group peptidase (beta-lactamase class C family)
MTDIQIHGFCDKRFQPLKDAFIANFDAGLELGASLALTYQGKTVVDLWAGWADAEQTRPWGEDTIVGVASTTKIAAIICMLMVVDRGLVELDAPVVKYWPEFAQGGKEAVTVRDALTHQAGVPAYDPVLTYEDLRDWDKVTVNIAAQTHRFGGERRVCYHLATYGFILGELLRRVDGRRPARFFREEIADKIGADFSIGLGAKGDLERLANVRYPDVRLPPPESPLMAYILAAFLFAPDLSWESLSIENPSGIGFGNGRSIARVCSILAMRGELDGRRYLSGTLVDEAAREQVSGEDPHMGWVSYGLGFGLHSPMFRAATPTSFHWGGYGGSWGLMDPKAGVSLGYAPNNWLTDVTLQGMDPRLERFSNALKTVLPRLEEMSA